MTASEIRQLLEKYKRNALSDAELLQLQELVGGGEFEAAIKEDILEALYADVADGGWEQQDKAAILRRILGKEVADMAGNVGGYTKPLTGIRRSWMAAAAVLALAAVAGGSYIALRSRPETQQVAVRKAPLAPGTNKAMLILADNSTVALDSSSNGTVAMQGNTQVTNANGALSYEAGGNSDKVVYNTMVTPRGGQYQLTLADGSKVWLNAASSIRFPTVFRGKERLVEVTGEAYFEIQQDASRPFRVKVNAAGGNDMTINVLGTSFNVMAYPDEQSIRTTLVDGTVQLEKGDVRSMLKPGFQAVLPAQGSNFDIAPADIEQDLAWKEGKFRFVNTNIRVIMRQLARWYDIDVQYDGNVSDIDFTGVISRRADAGALLKALETTQRVKFSVSGSSITVTPAGQH
ncbi:MAG TPA: FecR domain-containing protein [Chitinophaga sp.]|uniref:FecR family protein n=1 Tax=Chitinophaga sp. TaxID=1869181 RepID=UPI002CED8A52|nr:FecR domain-containing protein [Chitinophaga sp.]HVI43965.1 FecR domain-containing protein [Chitinophaga sp.]